MVYMAKVNIHKEKLQKGLEFPDPISAVSRKLLLRNLEVVFRENIWYNQNVQNLF